MKLLDFSESDVLNQLRTSMGADQLGSFELFNPLKHLSWQEKQLLAKDWQVETSTSLHANHDQSLFFKNSPVVAKQDEVAHFAYCDALKKCISQGKMPKINITTNTGLLHGEKPCEYCLHAMDHEGFDVYRHRHQQYNETVLKRFNLARYFTEKYPEFSGE